MKALKAILRKMGFGRTKIRRQMHMVYAIAFLIPITVIGMILLIFANQMLREHYIDLLESDNRRVKTMLTEITTQTYTIAKDITTDAQLRQLLSTTYEDSNSFVLAVNEYDELDEILYDAQELDSIYIYTDNPSVKDYKQYHYVTEKMAASEWWIQAIGQGQAFWTTIPRESDRADDNLSLVKQITMDGSEYHAIAVVRLSDSYIYTHVNSGHTIDAIMLDDKGVVYSSKKDWYGLENLLDIDYGNSYYKFSGDVEVQGAQCFATVSTTSLNLTNSKLYICTMDEEGFDNIGRIVRTWAFVLLFAILVPGIVLIWFANYFAGRVYLLREEMHKARLQDYNIISELKGNDELTEAFEDLKVMVADIKDKEAKMYEAQLKEKELRNNQQIMEYKMLASQINPHYLYNTLETIRMKALTSGDREVADSIKILGKTLHYVLENTGTSSTTLKKELTHVENYLTIQKLRFGDRINYEFHIQKDLNTEEYSILPLLLQPVVENAVVHGLEVINGTGMVVIEVTCVDEECIQIIVSDSGKGMTAEELEKIRNMLDTPELHPQSSVALYNINQRIRLFYGEEYGIELQSEYGKGTRVILNLPAFLPENC